MAAWQSNRALGRFRPRGCGETVPAHRWISCFARPSHRTRVRPQAAQNDRSRRLKVDNVLGEPSRISTEKRTSSVAFPPAPADGASALAFFEKRAVRALTAVACGAEFEFLEQCSPQK